MSSHPHPSPTSSTSPRSPKLSTSHLRRSPIIPSRPPPVSTHTLSPSQPQFAELLTPQKLRRRRRVPPSQGGTFPGSIPLQAGPSNHGFYTDDGVFRGSAIDPTRYLSLDNDEAITLSGSSTSSGSSEGGLDRAMAVLERFGTVIGVRRGSGSSGSTGTDLEVERGGRMRGLSRTTTVETDHPKREHLPKKREFVLLLPPPRSTSDTGTPRDSFSSYERRPPSSNRVITTPSLPIVVDHIRRLRTASGMLQDTPPPTPDIARPRPKMPRSVSSFFAPPIPSRPARSRLQTLRKLPVRPKSVSDLIGMAKPYGSAPNLAALRSTDFALPKRVGSPKTEGKGKEKEKGCWWLDVSCPGWEDLRDLGEVSEAMDHPKR